VIRAALILLALFCAEAQAGKNDPTWNPPAPFDHPYSGELIERQMPQAKVVSTCRSMFRKYGVKAVASNTQRGCAAVISPGKCLVVYIDKPFRSATPQSVRRHEIGHCNGWPASHP
jgi:hypothetical protein